MRTRKLLLCAIALLLAAAPISPAWAVDDSPGADLGGYDAQASAMAFSFQPVLPALVSTGDVPFEASVALTTGRVKSGGNALSRASILWPGSAAANLGPILGVAFGQPEIGALIPPWPLNAEANQSSGEVITGAPPAVLMHASGYPDSATGDSRIADLDVPSLVHVENVASTSQSVVTDGGVTSVGRVALQGVSILDGHITIESLRSISRTTSNATVATTGGDVDIVGMKIGGIDVSVTDEGFQVKGLPPGAEEFPGADGEPFPGQSPQDQVNEVLHNLGARITLFKGVGKRSGGRADHLELGLVVSVDNPLGGQGPIPPGRFDFIFGSTSSSSLATPPFNIVGGVGSGGTVSNDESSGSSVSSLGEGPSVNAGSLTRVGEQLASGGVGERVESIGPLNTAGRRVNYSFGGVPIGLTIGLLLAALLVARYIRNFLSSIIGAGEGP